MRAKEFINETSSTGQGGGSAGIGGGAMVGGPGTYEQEYGMFKSHGQRRTLAMTETLDSSYPFEGNPIGGRYTFVTDGGMRYMVFFGGRDMVEIAFGSRPESSDSHSLASSITGTGDSRKVFGTIIKIIQDYVAMQQPNVLYFTAFSQEPSRVKLFTAFAKNADKALPDYEFGRPMDMGSDVAFLLRRKGSEDIDEDAAPNTTTLTQIYQHERPDDNEQIWDYGTMIWDDPLEIRTITARELDRQLCQQYDVEGVEDLFSRMSKKQHKIVNRYMKDPNLSNYIIVTDEGHIVDGNHRAIAAVLTGKPIKYVDVSEEA